MLSTFDTLVDQWTCLLVTLYLVHEPQNQQDVMTTDSLRFAA